MFDATFGVRRDSSSQGGYLIMLVPQETFDGVEMPYHMIDWKSSKLPRIARSSLASQAAGQSVDAVEFCCRFGNTSSNRVWILDISYKRKAHCAR